MHKFLLNKYNELLVSDALRGFGLSLISLFVPIFLLTEGFSLTEVVVFEIVLLGISYLMHLAVDHVLGRMGLKRGLIVSYTLVIAFYMMLYAVDAATAVLGHYGFLFLAGFLNATALSFYWMSHHYYFIHSTRRKDEGSKLGTLKSIPMLLSVTSPLFGGWLITQFGFNGAFFATVLLLAAASCALLVSREISVHPVHEVRGIIDLAHMSKNMVYFIEGAIFVGSGFIWPIFLFLISVDLLAIGSLYFVSNAGYAIVSYVSGRMSDRRGVGKLVTIGAFGQGASLIGRVFARSIGSLAVLQTAGGLFAPLWILPIHTFFFKTSHKHTSNSVLNREFYMHMGRITAFVVFLALLLLFDHIYAASVMLVIIGVATFFLSIFFEEHGMHNH